MVTEAGWTGPRTRLRAPRDGGWSPREAGPRPHASGSGRLPCAPTPLCFWGRSLPALSSLRLVSRPLCPRPRSLRTFLLAFRAGRHCGAVPRTEPRPPPPSPPGTRSPSRGHHNASRRGQTVPGERSRPRLRTAAPKHERGAGGTRGRPGRRRVWGPRLCPDSGARGPWSPLSSDSRHLPFGGLSLLVRKTGSLPGLPPGAPKGTAQARPGGQAAGPRAGPPCVPRTRGRLRPSPAIRAPQPRPGAPGFLPSPTALAPGTPGASPACPPGIPMGSWRRAGTVEAAGSSRVVAEPLWPAQGPGHARGSRGSCGPEPGEGQAPRQHPEIASRHAPSAHLLPRRPAGGKGTLNRHTGAGGRGPGPHAAPHARPSVSGSRAVRAGVPGRPRQPQRGLLLARPWRPPPPGASRGGSCRPLLASGGPSHPGLGATSPQLVPPPPPRSRRVLSCVPRGRHPLGSGLLCEPGRPHLRPRLRYVGKDPDSTQVARGGFG